MANLRVDKITSTETFETTGSVQFHQDNDNYLSGTITAIGTQDFTIECWVYLLANRSSQHQRFFGNDDGAFDSNTLNMRFTPNTTIEMYYGPSPGNVTSDKLSESTWYHVAMSYSDNIARCYVDGKEFGRIHGNYDLGNTTMFIGGTYTVGGENFNGHVSNARLIVGKGIYPENFKPPMRELEVTPETVLLACQSKTDKLEERSGNTTLSATGSLHSASELTPGILTPVPKAGAGSAITGSVEFDGTGDYMTITETEDFDFGDGDFTIEYWYWESNNSKSERRTLDMRDSTRQWMIGHTNDNGGKIFFESTGAQIFSENNANTTNDRENWRHLAVVRNGNTVTIFLDGVNRGSGSFTGTISDDQNTLNIGRDSATAGREYQGFLSNLRIVKGTALYTDDFIPPTRELKKVPGTVLLCCQDPDNPFTEATGKTITGYGSLQREDGVELITNGTFNSDVSNWTATDCTLTYSSGQMQVTRSGGGGLTANQAFTTVAGNKYNLSGTINSSGSRGDLRVYDGSGTGGSNIISLFGTNGAVTDLRGTFIASSTTSTVVISVDTNSTSVTVDNISVTLADGSNRGSNFTPQVGDNRKVTFEGVTKINSDAYFYLPTGDTESREATGTYNAGTRGIFCGGEAPGSANSDRIEYITIASLGDTIDFGNLTVARRGGAGGCASHVRGLTGGAYTGPANNNIIDYFTITSTGNALDFGDMTGTSHNSMAVSNETRGVWMGGYTPASGSPVNTLQYVTISSTGNARDFGDLTRQVRGAASISSPVRGVCAGGAPSTQNTMDYITISTTGNANDFGDLTVGRDICAGGGNSKRGVIFMGRDPSMTNIIDYITIASMGNAIDFGDSISSGYILSDGASSSRRVVFAGIMNPGYNTNMDFIEISTTGNAQDFGDHSTNQQFNTGLSNSHGGLG